jgi:carbamoyl-phosphate synthase small subunit
LPPTPTPHPPGRVEISAQNHNFAVDPATLPAGVEVTHINLNDGTCAGMVYPAMKAMTIQYHPEASPGPHDADVCFEQFVQMMADAAKPAVAA